MRTETAQVPAALEAPIFHFNEQRDDLVRSVVDRVVDEASHPVLLLNDVAWHEIRRLEAEGDHDGASREQRFRRSLGSLDVASARALLRSRSMDDARDVAGNFDHQVYTLAARVVPAGLSVLFRPSALRERGLRSTLRGEPLEERLQTQGSIEHVRKLTALGTVLYVPTHLSNLDSPVFAWALESVGLPPVTYGAAKNLFDNPVLAFFLRNLGAYRVDRSKRHELYRTVLKTYSCQLIERGFHSMFFPAGARSRSGAVEVRPKLGLLGTGLEAFIRTSLGSPACRPRKVFVVPVTINYAMTLEARTLIDDHLAEQGRARYVIEDDESSRLAVVGRFLKRVMQMEGACVVRFGAPLDPLGHAVDEIGVSHDSRGRVVDPTSYVTRAGTREVVLDPPRDAQYTRELGAAVVNSWHTNTVVMPTHIVATAAFESLRAAHPGLELFGLLREADTRVRFGKLLEVIERIRRRVAELEAHGRLVSSSAVRGATARELFDDAERALHGYHETPVLRREGERIALGDPRLIFFYQNRLTGHGLGWDSASASNLGEQR